MTSLSSCFVWHCRHSGNVSEININELYISIFDHRSADADFFFTTSFFSYSYSQKYRSKSLGKDETFEDSVSHSDANSLLVPGLLLYMYVKALANL